MVKKGMLQKLLPVQQIRHKREQEKRRGRGKEEQDTGPGKEEGNKAVKDRPV
jgi:hypothetical protein